MSLIRQHSRPNGRRKPAKPNTNNKAVRNTENHTNRTVLKVWIGIADKHQADLSRFLIEFGYLTSTASSLTPGENGTIGLWIEKTLIDLPLLLDEWYSYSNKINDLKGVNLLVK